LKNLLTELGHFKQQNVPIYYDNNGAIQLSKNPIYHARTKYINVRYHLIRQKLIDGTISVHFIGTEDQKADGLTKPLSKNKLYSFLNQLEMIQIC
jgi:hypothetical protein